MKEISRLEALKISNNILKEAEKERSQSSSKETEKEILSDHAHSTWSNWMKYLFSKCKKINGDMIIPKDLVERWKRQMNTPYKELPEKEKESDIEIADEILNLLNY